MDRRQKINCRLKAVSDYFAIYAASKGCLGVENRGAVLLCGACPPAAPGPPTMRWLQYLLLGCHSESGALADAGRGLGRAMPKPILETANLDYSDIVTV